MIEGNYTACGLQFLSKFIVEFDFPKREIVFRPGKRINLPDQRDRSGLETYRIDGKVLVSRVAPGSAAELAAIQPNDELTRIDGTSTQTLTLVQIEEIFAEPGAVRSLEIRRDGIKKEVKSELENDPDPFPSVQNEIPQ